MCPVSILLHYIKRSDLKLESDMFLFRAMTMLKSTNNYMLKKENRRLSYIKVNQKSWFKSETFWHT